LSNHVPASEESPNWSSDGTPRTFDFASVKALQTPRTKILMSQVDREQAASPRSALWINQKRSEELASVLDARVLGRRNSAVLSPRSTEVLTEYQDVKSREDSLKHEYFRSLRAECASAESPEFFESPKTPRSRYLAHAGRADVRTRRSALKRQSATWPLLVLTIIAVLLFVAFGFSSGRRSTDLDAVEDPLSRSSGRGAGKAAAVAAPLRGSSNRARQQRGAAKKAHPEAGTTRRDENSNPLAGIQTVEELDRFVKAARADLLEAEATTAEDEVEPMHDADEGKG